MFISADVSLWQLRRALKAHRGHLYGRMVVTEECFRNEDEWHRVHDVAWKEHPHLPVTRTSQQPPAKYVLSSKVNHAYPFLKLGWLAYGFCVQAWQPHSHGQGGASVQLGPR